MPGYTGYIPQVKAENVYGKSYSKITGFQRSGSIKTKANDFRHNHWDNQTKNDKFRSTFTEKFGFDELKKDIRHDGPMMKGYDTFGFADSERYHPLN